MQNIGYITLNISLIIYFVHFLPQMLHNQFKHKTLEISLWTHSLMILANSFDLIYAIGFGLQWQYVLVDVILLSFLVIQQFQILNDRRDKYIAVHSILIIIFLLLVMFVVLYINLSSKYLLVLGSIGGIIYNLYWLPQIYKNYRQKQAEGFSIVFLTLSLVSVMCDLSSAIFLGWPVLSIIVSLSLAMLLLLQVFQYFYYKNFTQICGA
ncbi:PQ-loop repeat-containing protein [Allofrancisella guangzhouensis]|uniref:PQ loop repeat family protein n=1 Tax=Allofrancisella guangzhouensis TaxID=594679 RepID=A0A0A8E5F0_9GAMM|nr:PQ-loop repeat-containing protein [Allofrancisella guangzhouensis]AJC49169.1 hypothetical protein SD28_05745 [Allofrancisella guangzhouensis]MBK2026773.1 PQ-loop repeat-containing protein [Allofrancisella guangzhouensis]MBK2044445.1 PQ-loop repeat-containing protein [Allofrancisella guangzhouensis]MBK2045347.1 PQ-loop repeat-containing protein [Allofrancisella guangzhouensis]